MTLTGNSYKRIIHPRDYQSHRLCHNAAADCTRINQAFDIMRIQSPHFSPKWKKRKSFLARHPSRSDLKFQGAGLLAQRKPNTKLISIVWIRKMIAPVRVQSLKLSIQLPPRATF